MGLGRRKSAKLSRPGVPGVPFRRRAFERSGRSISPFAGPKIPIPDGGDELFEGLYLEWRAVYNGSKPEFITFQYLVERRKQEVNIDFLFQYPLLGGRTRFGGFILDFFFPIRREAWRVQGERFHRLLAKDRAKDAIARVILAQRGLTVLDLWESDLLTRPDFVLDLAWERSGQVPKGRGS